MKKMKNVKIFAAFGAAVLGLAFSSCSNDDYKFDPNYEAELQKSLFDQSFIKKYGEVNTEHDWGFQDIPCIKQEQTRVSAPNSNEWESVYHLNVPDNITNYEAEYVYNYFKNIKGNATSMDLHYCDFFVQHVWKGKDQYKDAYNQDVVGGDQMDYIIIGQDHGYNFNSTTNDTNKGAMYIMDGSTDTFGYHNSRDSKNHFEYLLLAINVPGVGLGYYVGFDFYANGPEKNMQVERDYVYTDWIIKVIPGKYGDAKRIMCEDLGTTDDFDFNDVVFDVYINYNEYWHGNDFGIITLQAAGGTIPLYVDGKEVHEMFGVETSTMVNTGAGEERPAVQWRFTPKSANPNDIEVKVIQDAITYTLSAPKGKVPYKIAVPITVDWAEERQQIEQKYPKFMEWVKNPSVNFWN